MKRLCERKCPWLNLTFIGFILTSLSLVSSIVTVGYFGKELWNLRQYDYIYSYTPHTCTPISSKSLEVTCTNNQGLNKIGYIAYFTLDSMFGMVESPFMVSESRLISIQDQHRIALNQSYTCMCQIYVDQGLGHPRDSSLSNYRSQIHIRETEEFRTYVMTVPVIKDCGVWTDCILDVDFISYIQHNNKRYESTYVSFIISSVIAIVLSIISIPIYVKQLRANRREQYIDLDNHL